MWLWTNRKQAIVSTGHSSYANNISSEWYATILYPLRPVANAPLFTYAYFYCSDEDAGSNKPVCRNQPWENIGWLWKNHVLVFCPLLFDERRMTSLHTKVLQADGKPEMQNTMDYWKPVRARSMFHETYLYRTTLSVPHT